MASKKLMDLLNAAAAREIQVSIQYVWQHVMVKGIESESVAKVFQEISVEEMKHYEAIAERIDYLGGRPTVKPTEIKFGETTKEMLQIDKKAEEEAIDLYKGIIKVATQEGDNTTKFLFEDILKQEEEHHYKFKTLLGE